MPCYDYCCAKCGVMEITHGMRETVEKCPVCGLRGIEKQFNTQVQFRGPVDSGWQLENGGKGRYFPQLGRKTDPKSYVRSISEAPDRAARRGQRFERD